MVFVYLYCFFWMNLVSGILMLLNVFLFIWYLVVFGGFIISLFIGWSGLRWCNGGVIIWISCEKEKCYDWYWSWRIVKSCYWEWEYFVVEGFGLIYVWWFWYGVEN